MTPNEAIFIWAMWEIRAWCTRDQWELQVAGRGTRAAHRIWKENMRMSGKTDRAMSGDEGKARRGKEGAAREALAGMCAHCRPDFYQIMQQHIPKDGALHSQGQETIKSWIQVDFFNEKRVGREKQEKLNTDSPTVTPRVKETPRSYKNFIC